MKQFTTSLTSGCFERKSHNLPWSSRRGARASRESAHPSQEAAMAEETGVASSYKPVHIETHVVLRSNRQQTISNESFELFNPFCLILNSLCTRWILSPQSFQCTFNMRGVTSQCNLRNPESIHRSVKEDRWIGILCYNCYDDQMHAFWL